VRVIVDAAPANDGVAVRARVVLVRFGHARADAEAAALERRGLVEATWRRAN